MSDDREDVTPEPGDGSDVGDSAATPAADDTADVERAKPSSEVAAAAKPSGKRRGPGKASARPATAGKEADTTRPGAKGRATPARAKQEVASKGNPASRILRYLREVVAELRKVIWPTRNELITYTAVVLVFVAFMVALTSGLDLAFARGVLLIFG